MIDKLPRDCHSQDSLSFCLVVESIQCSKMKILEVFVAIGAQEIEIHRATRDHYADNGNSRALCKKDVSVAPPKERK